MQALDDASLKALGRLHTAHEALAAVAIARVDLRALFVRPDLCPARPDAADVGATNSQRAIARAAEHLSLYQLTIEPGTPFFGAARRRQARRSPDEDAARELYDVTQEVCARAGLPAYEISNHARPGAECRHNLVYWRDERICRHRPRRARPPRHRRHAPRHRDREAAGGLADAGRSAAATASSPTMRSRAKSAPTNSC